MSHLFLLPITYEGTEREYPALLVSFSYTYKFLVQVAEHELVFETDDEGQFRVIGSDQAKSIDPALLQCIIDALQYLIQK